MSDVTIVADDINDDTPLSPEQREAYREWLQPDLTHRHVSGAIGESHLEHLWQYLRLDDLRWKEAKRQEEVAKAKAFVDSMV